MLTKAEKEKWLTALRSGDYSQIRGSLHTDKGFCCLGVLCDVVDPDGWAGDPDTSCYTHHGEYTLLCPTIRDRLDYDSISSLITMNDVQPMSDFNDIANWIEENLPTEG